MCKYCVLNTLQKEIKKVKRKYKINLKSKKKV